MLDLTYDQFLEQVEILSGAVYSATDEAEAAAFEAELQALTSWEWQYLFPDEVETPEPPLEAEEIVPEEEIVSEEDLSLGIDETIFDLSWQRPSRTIESLVLT